MNRGLDRLFNSRVDVEMSYSILFILFMVSAALFDVKTIHGGGNTYLHGAARRDRCGAVNQRAKSVPVEDIRKAANLDATPAVQLHNGRVWAVTATLIALGAVRALVFGQYGEASTDVSALLHAARIEG
jgi:hypothetical protein